VSDVVARRHLLAAPAVAALGAVGRRSFDDAAVPPGVHPRYRTQLAGHTQVVVALGQDLGSDHVVVSNWVRTRRGWVRLGRWAGHNGMGGWSTHHHAGDLHTPVGVYSLTNAGGYLPNPGTRLPYQYDPGFYGLLDNGVRTFDYVIGINYDHVVGTPPSDGRRPLGVEAGGDIWLHVDHGSGTHGCVTIPRAGLAATLRWLRPAADPVMLMGPRSIIGSP
jgi:L,D-peptidoglycan transpeptidase YkuD (ErfK/YbiS/YcfS/YnhG family)